MFFDSSRALLASARLSFVVKYYETASSTLSYAKRLLSAALGSPEPSLRLQQLAAENEAACTEYSRLLHLSHSIYMLNSFCQVQVGNFQEAKIDALVAAAINQQLHSQADRPVCDTCRTRALRSTLHHDDQILEGKAVCSSSCYTTYVSELIDAMLLKQSQTYEPCRQATPAPGPLS